jgi:drug/metabolite transporter (DMT)-like permease
MEVLGAGIVVIWFAVVIWGAASLVNRANQTNDWDRVCIAALSAATVAGPFLLAIPEHIFFEIIYTRDLGYALMLISGLLITALASGARKGRILNEGEHDGA